MVNFLPVKHHHVNIVIVGMLAWCRTINSLIELLAWLEMK